MCKYQAVPVAVTCLPLIGRVTEADMSAHASFWPGLSQVHESRNKASACRSEVEEYVWKHKLTDLHVREH